MSALSCLSLMLYVAARGAAPDLPAEQPPRGAGPTITIRGSTRLDLEKIEPVQGGVMLTVRLQDGELGEAIPDRTITVSIRREGREVFRASRQTTRKGSAQIFVPHQRGDHDIALSFGGDPLYSAAAPTLTKVDLSKEAVQLHLTAPPRVDVGAGSVSISVVARQQAPIAFLPVTVRARRGGKIVLKRVGQTDADGQLRLALPTKELGSAGEVHLEAQSDATAQYNSARTSQRIFVVSDTTTTLRFPRARGRRDARLKVSGEVADASGPVAQGTVRLLALGTVLLTLRTDDGGRYRGTLHLAALPLGQVAVVAQFVPGTAWQRPSRSKPVVLMVEPHRPIPIAYYLVPALLTLLFLVSVFLARRKPWRSLGARWRARRSPSATQRGGIELGRRHSIRGLFGVDLHGLRGTVLDLHERRALRGATVYLRSPDAAASDQRTRTEEDGTFSLSDASSGPWELLVTFPGYLPQSLAVTLPHHGELHGILVRLESVRHRVMEVYAAAMAPRLPDPALVRYWTPAEATAHLRSGPTPPPAAVEALSDLASEVYYGPDTPATEAATEAEALAARARASALPAGEAREGEDGT